VFHSCSEYGLVLHQHEVFLNEQTNHYYSSYDCHCCSVIDVVDTLLDYYEYSKSSIKENSDCSFIIGNLRFGAHVSTLVIISSTAVPNSEFGLKYY